MFAQDSLSGMKRGERPEKSKRTMKMIIMKKTATKSEMSREEEILHFDPGKLNASCSEERRERDTVFINTSLPHD